MMSGSILTSDEMRLRLIDLEYKNLSAEELVEQIERVYIEEFGNGMPATIDVFNSSESQRLNDDTSGYDGTAIYFYSEENDINEIYVVSQGTQDKVDWDYNIKSMFAGIDYTQASSVDKFVEESKEKFFKNDNIDIMDQNIPIIGLSFLSTQ